MRSKMLSVIVGTEECIAKCPFCVSCEPVRGTGCKRDLNMRNFEVSLKYAEKAGVETMVLTSRGEPLLYPDEITQYLGVLQESNINIPFVELQTNGILFQAGKNRDLDMYLTDWYNKGLTHIALSTVSYKNKANALNYLGDEDANYPDLSETIIYLHKKGFSVRLVCVMCEEVDEKDCFVSTASQMVRYLSFARKFEVEQVTFRPVNMEYRREDTHNWCKRHLLSDLKKESINNFLADIGTVLQEIPRVGTVYDLQGQNVMFSVPLTKYTDNSDAESTRQLIYFPDGHLRYEWEKEGAILL